MTTMQQMWLLQLFDELEDLKDLSNYDKKMMKEIEESIERDNNSWD